MNKEQIIRIIKECIKTICEVLLILVPFQIIIAESYQVPSTSMQPNFDVSDRFVATKFSYGYGPGSFCVGLFNQTGFCLPDKIFTGRYFFTEPERGDVVVFRSTTKDLSLLKRLIGLPGDKIQMIKGLLYINGVAVKKKYIGEIFQKHEGHEVKYHLFEETLPNGKKYKIIELPFEDKTSILYNTILYEVPKNHYFMVGDNRNNSEDSRMIESVGYVPVENLTGKGQFLYYTSDFFSSISRLSVGRNFRSVS